MPNQNTSWLLGVLRDCWSLLRFHVPHIHLPVAAVAADDAPRLGTDHLLDNLVVSLQQAEHVTRLHIPDAKHTPLRVGLQLFSLRGTGRAAKEAPVAGDETPVRGKRGVIDRVVDEGELPQLTPFRYVPQLQLPR